MATAQEMRTYKNKKPWYISHAKGKERCNNKNHTAYKYYGARGIKYLLTLDEVEKLWNRDKAYLMDKPRLDRKENDGNYTFDNCQFLEHNDNIIKDQSIPVNQYDMNGIFIKEWISQSEASRQLNISQGNIWTAIHGIRPNAGGFKWRYK